MYLSSILRKLLDVLGLISESSKTVFRGFSNICQFIYNAKKLHLIVFGM